MFVDPASRRVTTIPVLSCALLAAFLSVGCAHLPYVLPDSRDHIVAIDIALSPEMAVAGRTDSAAWSDHSGARVCPQQ